MVPLQKLCFSSSCFFVLYSFHQYEVFLILTLQIMCDSERVKQLSDAIRLIPDFPSPGIIFRFILKYFLSM